MKKETMEFFMKEDFDDYIGEWIAIVDKKVVAHGKDARKIYQEAKKKYPNINPVLTMIPKKKTLILTLIRRIS